MKERVNERFVQRNGKVIKKSNVTASDKFVTILAVVSIVGLIGIISATLFNFNIEHYIEASWMIVIGIGFMLEGQFSTLKKVRIEGLTPTNFTHLTTLVIGLIALIAGIFSIPAIRIEYHGFLAVKGILALMAIVIIVVQTWVVR